MRGNEDSMKIECESQCKCETKLMHIFTCLKTTKSVERRFSEWRKIVCDSSQANN